MIGLNKSIMEAVLEATQEDKKLREFIVKLIVMEVEDKTPMSRRKEFTIEMADNYLSEVKE